MAVDPSQVIVTTGATAHSFRVHHSDLPELEADGETPAAAATNLAQDLAREIDAAADELHRGPLHRALDDVRAFLDRGAPPRP
jgi:hypothetical protein